MKIKEAMEHFHGVDDLNCIQSVLKVYQEEFDLSDEFIADAKINGGGRAEGGECGALYAIRELIYKSQPEAYNEISKKFKAETGSVCCEPIKEMERKTCRECVGLAVKYMEESKK